MSSASSILDQYTFDDQSFSDILSASDMARSVYSEYDPYDTLTSGLAKSTQSNNADVDGIFAVVATILGFGLIFWLLMIALAIVQIIGTWKAFSKAGHSGWECLIPGHNEFVRYTDGGLEGYWFFVALLPVANIIIPFWKNISYAKAFGKGAGFGVGLTLLPWIFFPILGFGKSEYIGNKESK